MTQPSSKKSCHEPAVLRVDETAEYFFIEGCHILEVANSERDPELSIARARVEPGVTTHLHSLTDTTERYVILAGSGRVRVGELEQTVAVGDVVIIPAGCDQQITNTGADDLLFYAICTPRFRPENYRDLKSN